MSLYSEYPGNCVIHRFPSCLLPTTSVICACVCMCVCPFPEPGYYHDGEFGIRLETILFVTEATTQVRAHIGSYKRRDTCGNLNHTVIL